jgi:hypothetical protein
MWFIKDQTNSYFKLSDLVIWLPFKYVLFNMITINLKIRSIIS